MTDKATHSPSPSLYEKIERYGAYRFAHGHNEANRHYDIADREKANAAAMLSEILAEVERLAAQAAPTEPGGDVEPVAWQKADRQETEDGWAIVGWLPCTKQEFNALLIPKRALCDASTVAALKARVAVLEESASQLAGVDLDGMVEAFHRIIDSQAQQSPFHNPVNADAALALRELRRLIPAIKAVALTKGQP